MGLFVLLDLTVVTNWWSCYVLIHSLFLVACLVGMRSLNLTDLGHLHQQWKAVTNAFEFRLKIMIFKVYTVLQGCQQQPFLLCYYVLYYRETSSCIVCNDYSFVKIVTIIIDYLVQ